MSQNNQGLFTTGAFAALCGVTKHTLFHYDQMGVFSPAVKKENGYRYYSTPQLEVFNVIAVLKELDMPLAEIKAYLDRRSPTELAMLLEREEAALTRKITELRHTRDLIRRKSALTREAMSLPVGSATLREEPAALLVRTPALPFDNDESTAMAVAQHVRYCQKHQIVSPYSISAMIDQDVVRAGDLETGYSHLYTRVERASKGVSIYEKPAGTYLSYCHNTGYNTLPEAYRRLLDYADEQGYTLRGPFYEDTLFDELSVRGYDHYVLQISILMA